MVISTLPVTTAAIGTRRANMRYGWVWPGWLTFALIAGSLCGESLAQGPFGDFIAKSDPRTPAEEKKCFHLPPGFEIELVASEPAIGKPINLNFDDRGRIWLTQSVEYPFPAPPGRTPRDVIKILESTRGAGVAGRGTAFCIV